MKKSVRVLTLALALLMLFSVFVACDNNDPEPDTTTTQAPTTNDPNGTVDDDLDENGYLKDDIPENTDLGNRVIRVLSWESRLPEMFSEGYTKDEINNEVYSRQAALEERLNFLFEPVSIPGDWQHMDSWLTQGRLCGDNNIDLIGTYSLWPGVLAQEGHLCNLNMLDYPNQDMPWWPDSQIEAWTQSGALYFISSNSSIPVLNSIRVILCNESMFEDLGLESPVSLAIKGDWYVDTMLEYISHFDSDLNADERVWGFGAWDHSAMDAMYYSAGFSAIKNNEYGEASFAVLEASTIMGVTTYIDKLATMFNSGNATILINLPEFNSNRVALGLAAFDVVTWLENMNYSAVPLPKLDENQENYRTIQHNNYDIWAVPAAAKDAAVSAIVLEGLASMDYRSLAPYYFDRYMKLRYSKTEDCMAMFDIVRNSLYYDFGRAMLNLQGVTEGAWRETFYDPSAGMVKADINSGSFTTAVQEKEAMVIENLNKALRNFRKYFDVGMQE